jgi:hypothetical protein
MDSTTATNIPILLKVWQRINSLQKGVVGFGVFMDVGMGMICCTLAKAKHGRRARKD